MSAASQNHDLCIERQPSRDLVVQLSAGDPLPNHEGPCRADIDRPEVLQLLRERGRPETPVTADVEAPHENHEGRGLQKVFSVRNVALRVCRSA